MIDLRPYTDLGAWSVFQLLDGHDYREAEAIRGAGCSNLGLFADWRQLEGARFLSHVVYARRGTTRIAFAVLGLCHTGQAGVAQAAMLAKQHKLFRRELAELGAAIRDGLPEYCRAAGVRRIEARAWAGHPTAARFLEAVGFTHEARMPGFGGDGAAEFHQFAYTPPRSRPDQGD